MTKTILIGLIGAIGLLAQGPAGLRGGGRGPGFGGPGFGPGPESRATIAGAPYSAVRVTASQQILANGNTIQRQEQMNVYRDSQGRTRTETTVQGPDGQTSQRVEIVDPVAGVMRTLDTQNKVARETPFRSPANMPQPGSPSAMPGRGRGGPGGNPQPGSLGARGGRSPNQVRPGGAAASNAQTDNLGTRTLNGVAAVGTRVTRTIPAGEIGNAQPLQIVRETWFSQDLGVPVMSSQSDPRTGTTVTQLTNILRVEPDAALFQAPAGYTTQRAGRGPGAPGPMRMGPPR
jgi:hypothetical protein